jgi:tRNA(Ile)-lysidine synthase
MFEFGMRIGVAVSGGADSVCLLYLLRELAERVQLTLAVVHLNHNLRGAEGDEDAEFVRGLARSLALPFHLESIDVRALCPNVEQAGRQARQAFFSRLRSSSVVDRIATAHTRSDQAETVLYRLLRGSGTAGLSGILPVTAEGVVRPLIDCTRDQVQDYLVTRGLPWREDRTNAELVFIRNRIRHHLLPEIEREYSPAAVHILGATAEVARDEEDYWASITRSLAARLFITRRDAVLIQVPDVRDLHLALARRLIRLAIREVKGDLLSIDIDHVERILALTASSEGHGRVQAPGIDVFRSFDWLRIARPRVGSRFDHDYCFDVGPDRLQRFPIGSDHAIYLEVLEDTDLPLSREGYNGTVSEFDRDLLPDQLELRNWHPGDEFQPPGRSKRKVKELFQEARIPIWERHGWPLITGGNETIWTRQFGAALQFARTPLTRRVLRVYEIVEVDRTG